MKFYIKENLLSFRLKGHLMYNILLFLQRNLHILVGLLPTSSEEIEFWFNRLKMCSILMLIVKISQKHL